jgi:hypothetical protein
MLRMNLFKRNPKKESDHSLKDIIKTLDMIFQNDKETRLKIIQMFIRDKVKNNKLSKADKKLIERMAVEEL